MQKADRQTMGQAGREAEASKAWLHELRSPLDFLLGRAWPKKETSSNSDLEEHHTQTGTRADCGPGPSTENEPRRNCYKPTRSSE